MRIPRIDSESGGHTHRQCPSAKSRLLEAENGEGKHSAYRPMQECEHTYGLLVVNKYNAEPRMLSRERIYGRTSAAAAVDGKVSTVSVPSAAIGEPSSEVGNSMTAAADDDAQPQIRTKKRQIKSNRSDSVKKPRSDKWQPKFELLCEFQRKHGHCQVPQRLVTESSVKLGQWVKSQRVIYRNCCT